MYNKDDEHSGKYTKFIIIIRMEWMMGSLCPRDAAASVSQTFVARPDAALVRSGRSGALVAGQNSGG